MDNYRWSHVRILCRRPALCVASNYRTLKGTAAAYLPSRRLDMRAQVR
ncbi:MAG: hypothetical protein IJQ01_02585 [Selenomonadaceae bacterium]|nr:hypothetical protein [Selenomonadaceae bacterium]